MKAVSPMDEAIKVKRIEKEKIAGVEFHKAMIDAAKHGAKGEGIIGTQGAELILKAARPDGDISATNDKLEKQTLAYIRAKFKLTTAAGQKLRAASHAGIPSPMKAD